MNFKFLLFIFYNTVSQTEIIENQNNYVNIEFLSEMNYGHAEIKCEINSCDRNNNYQLYECATYSAIVHLPTKAICFINRTNITKDAISFPLYQFDFETDNSNNKPLKRKQRPIFYVFQPLNLNSDNQGQNYNHIGSDTPNTDPESYNSGSTDSPNPQMKHEYQLIWYSEPSSLNKLCFEYSFNLYRPNPYIFFDPRFSIAQYCHYTSPNIVMNKLNPLQINILHHIWTVFMVKKINELEPKLLDFLSDRRKNNKCWTIFEDKKGIFQKKEKTKIFYHKPETFNKFCFFKKIDGKVKKNFRKQYLVLKGEPGPNFKNLRWNGDNVFIWDSENIKENVTLCRHVFIGPGCRIESNSVILQNCLLNKNVEIGPNTRIGFMTYLGTGCKIGVDIEKYRIQNYEKVVPTFEKKVKEFHDRELVFKTFLKGYNYIENNLIFQIGYLYDDYLIYYHMI